MGIFTRWFTRKPTADVELLSALMKGQTEAAAQRNQIEMKRQDLELRRLELEFQHLEEAADVRRKDREAAAELRERRREWAAKSREALRVKRGQAIAANGPKGACRVCANGGDPSLSAAEITWHWQGHPGAQAQQ